MRGNLASINLSCVFPSIMELLLLLDQQDVDLRLFGVSTVQGGENGSCF